MERYQASSSSATSYSPSNTPTSTQTPTSEEQLRYQLEFYFSAQNLATDAYLRRKMDDQGFVDVKVVAGFRRVQFFTTDLGKVIEAARSSEVLDAQHDGGKGWRVRSPASIAAAAGLE